MDALEHDQRVNGLIRGFLANNVVDNGRDVSYETVLPRIPEPSKLTQIPMAERIEQRSTIAHYRMVNDGTRMMANTIC